MSLPHQEFVNNIPPDIYDDEFITLINALNESIKENFKVSKHNIREANNFLVLLQEKFKIIENIINEIPQEKSLENIKKIFQIFQQSQYIVNQLLKNSLSNDNNLNLFFDDAKTLFKKLKLKRNEGLMNFRRSLRSLSSKKK